MQNDRQPKPPSPIKFEARQPEAGTALLFFISGGSLALAREVFHPAHDWQRADLSSAQLARDLPYGRCTDFATALSVPAPGRPQAIHLAMVVRDEGDDRLYLSLSNPAADLAWSAAPLWLACPFDGVPAVAATPAPRLAITRVQLGDASDRPFIVVDAIVDPNGALPRRVRYCVDTSVDGVRPRWIEHKLPVSDAGIRAACLGRCRGGWDVDGLYLAGDSKAAAGEEETQLLYAPLYNPFDPMQPRWSRRLEIPGKAAAEAIAACRHADNTADLYVAAAGALHYFSAANQNDGAQALTLVAAPEFAGVDTLFASARRGRVTVWGLSRTGQVICTSAPQVYVADPAAWSRPAVALSNVDAIAPCPDGDEADDAFFAHTAGGLIKVTRSPGNNLWISYSIVLPLRA
jgi:hypothetical protein